MRWARFSYWHDLVVASDPGLLRFRSALRSTFIAAVSAFVLSRLSNWLGKQTLPTLVGVSIAMMASFTLNDPSPREQRVTLAFVPIAAGTSTALGALVSRSLALSQLVFVAVIFVAVFVRRFGQRWFTLGMMFFLSYFFSMFFRATLGEWPWIFVGIVVATGIGYLVRFLLMPDRTRNVLPEALRAYRVRAANVLLGLADDIRTSRFRKKRELQVTKQVAKLNRAALDLETALEAIEPSCVGGHKALEALRARIFEIELSVESCAATVNQILQAAPVRPEAAGHLTASTASVKLHAGLAAAHDSLKHEGNDPVWGLSCPGELVFRVGPQPISNQSQFEPAGMEPATRQAIQAAIAGGLAMVAGNAVSSSRWYWAVIAAFIVFNRASTLGESLTRAWERSLGTVIGVGVGLLVAELVRGAYAVELFLLFACLFAALYFFRVAYAGFILCFTLALVLLYRLLGKYTPGLMVLRLEETLVGAAIGAAVAALIFPARPRARLLAKIAEMMEPVAEFVRRAAGGTPRQGETWIQVAREIDNKWLELRAIAEATEPLPFGKRLGNFSSLVHAASGIAFYVRVIARELDANSPDPLLIRSSLERLSQLRRRLERNLLFLEQRRRP